MRTISIAERALQSREISETQFAVYGRLTEGDVRFSSDAESSIVHVGVTMLLCSDGVSSNGGTEERAGGL